jgi:uncharacterized protein (DUF1501 family)
MVDRPPSRRDLLRILGGGAATLGLGARPWRAHAGAVHGTARRAASIATDRKFLFIHAVGGWDPTWALAPMFGYDSIDVDPSATRAQAGDLAYVDAANRPSVRSFFDANFGRSCLLHGFEVRSVTHERCRRILMTGTSGAVADDWAALLAGSVAGYVLPSLVFSGPAYTARYATSTVRVGQNSQLVGLLDGTALDVADARYDGLPPASQDAVEALVRTRATRAAAAATGPAARLLGGYSSALDQLAAVREALRDVDLTPDSPDGCARLADVVAPAITCLARGWSRCVTVEHTGFCDGGWDSHSAIPQQGTNFELLFSDLINILAQLDRTMGTSGRPLSEEVTVVVLSEMGRTPRLNGTGGKDHWTFTSALLVGAGVRAGRAIGGYDSDLIGLPVDLATGEPDDAGTPLTSAHLGATLLALGDVDPAAHTLAESLDVG